VVEYLPTMHKTLNSADKINEIKQYMTSVLLHFPMVKYWKLNLKISNGIFFWYLLRNYQRVVGM
jgi:hypothetical protein